MTQQPQPVELTSCPDPDCGAPAEVVDRYTLPAAGSPPITHVATSCVRKHHLTHTED